MKFDVIEFDNKEKWAEIVKDKEVYFQWEYVDAFYKNGDGSPRLAYAKYNDDYVFYVFLLRDIAKDLDINKDEFNYYDILTPYGYGGVDFNNENRELLDFFFAEFEKYCHKNNIISEFIRFNPFLNNHEYYDVNDYNILNISKTVHMKLNDLDQIWNDLESRCRNTIRKAQKNNLVVKSDYSRESFDNFVYIYKETMKRDNADNYYYFNDDFFDSMYKNLERFAKVYTVYFEDKPISSSIILFNGENAHYHLSGTLSEYLSLGANSIGLYEIAIDLCKNGYKRFHLGGGYGGDNSPLLKFKKSFNKFGELDFYIGKRIYNQDIYNKLCELKNISNTESYFPAYRKN